MPTTFGDHSKSLDLTSINDDSQRSGFRTPRRFAQASTDDAFSGSRERPESRHESQFRSLHQGPMITAGRPRDIALATPPASRSYDADATQRQKRQRPSSLSPSLTRETLKRGRFDGLHRRATASPDSEELSCFEVEPGNINIDDDSSSTTSTESAAIAGRNSVVHQDGHILRDPVVFSPKPFKWDEWTPKDYSAMSTFLEGTFDATGFAKGLSSLDDHRTVTTEEVSWMLRAVVTRPLRIAECSKRRGEEGMQELREYVEKHGTKVRVWSTGRTMIRGEFLGLERYGVVIALATTKFGMAEQDAADRISEELVVEKGSGRANLSMKRLRSQDVEYLKGILNAKDLRRFKRWERKIKADDESTKRTFEDENPELQQVGEV